MEFIFTDCGTGNRYVPQRKTPMSQRFNSRVLTAKRRFTVYTGGFQAYNPLDKDDTFDCEYIVHGDDEYADGEGQVNTCESHGSVAQS